LLLTGGDSRRGAQCRGLWPRLAQPSALSRKRSGSPSPGRLAETDVAYYTYIIAYHGDHLLFRAVWGARRALALAV